MRAKVLKTFLIITTISIASTVYAQIAVSTSKAEPTKTDASKTENLPESVRKEIKNFEDRRKAINDECRKKREELKAALSPEARNVIEDKKEKRRMERKEARAKREMEKAKMVASPSYTAPSILKTAPVVIKQ